MGNLKTKIQSSNTKTEVRIEKTATTFRVSKKKPEKFPNYPSNENRSDNLKWIISSLPQYDNHHCTEVLQGSHFSPQTRVSKPNGFVNTIVQCYNHHHNLIIRPDDVWTAIITQFSFYVNANSEEFRSKFVDFDGKKELVVYGGGTVQTASYDSLTNQMTAVIDKNLVDPEFKDWILPNFSTTTKDDIVTCGVVFMASMKKYFDYKCTLLCGIPWITLEGTLNDWKIILARLTKLRSYKLGKWVDMLEPILQQFVKAKQGKVDLEFWGRVCHHEDAGSGPSYLSGWITAFCVFDKDGKWQEIGPYQEYAKYDRRWLRIEMDHVPSGVVEVNVKIQDNGTDYYTVMFAGHMALELLDDFTVRPKVGWAISLKPSPEEIERNEKSRGGFL